MTRQLSPRRRPRATAQKGFSLVEVLIALTLIAGALTSLAQLCAIAARANLVARRTTLGAVLAAAKMEQLREDWAHAVGGSLESDVTGFSDACDDGGRSLGAGPPSRSGAAFVRRWSVEPVAADPLRSRILRVRVVPQPSTRGPQWPGTQQGESRLLTLATQKDR